MAAAAGKEGVEAAVAAAIQAREQVISDIMAEMAERERGRFITICTRHSLLDPKKEEAFENLTVATAIMATATGDVVEAAVAAAIQARVQILSDVMADIAERERGRFMTICNYLPDKASLVDKAVLVSILLQVGYINIDDVEDDLNVSFDGIKCNVPGWSFEIDDHGRITRVVIGYRNRLNEVNVFEPYNLPAAIARLDKLNDLMVVRCLSLPAKELSSMPHLQTLCVHSCSNLLEHFPVQMELKYLTRLIISDCRFQSSSPVFKWVQQLSILKLLDIYYMEENDIDCILSILRTIDMKFQDKLKDIRLYDCKINDNRFETLLFEILPRFPNVSRLDLKKNEIQSVRHIVDRIKNDQTCFVSKSLRRLEFENNPMMDKVEKNDPNEKAALLSFLRTFNTVYNIGVLSKDDYSSDIGYALRINQAGRRILEGGGHRVGSIPLSLWPTILERAYEKSDDSICDRETDLPKNATGLYYLLRNGPALAGRLSFGGNGRLLSSSSDCNDDVNDKGDGNDDDDNNKDDNAKENAPTKRKLGESKGVLETANDDDDDDDNDNDDGRSK